MREHHQRTLHRLVNHVQNDPAFPALLVGGSIARGWDREDSDVDIFLVARDEDYAHRAAAHAYHYYTTEFCDYPGGYVDGKIVNTILPMRLELYPMGKTAGGVASPLHGRHRVDLAQRLRPSRRRLAGPSGLATSNVVCPSAAGAVAPSAAPVSRHQRRRLRGPMQLRI